MAINYAQGILWLPAAEEGHKERDRQKKENQSIVRRKKQTALPSVSLKRKKKEKNRPRHPPTPKAGFPIRVQIHCPFIQRFKVDDQ